MPLEEWEKVGRDDPYYKDCLTVAVAGGAALGMVVTAPAGAVPLGFVAGAVWGFAIGYLACPYVVPAIKRKFESGQALSVHETRQAAEAMGQYANVVKASDAVKLVAIARSYALRKGAPPAGVCRKPAEVAQQLLETKGEPVGFA